MSDDIIKVNEYMYFNTRHGYPLITEGSRLHEILKTQKVFHVYCKSCNDNFLKTREFYDNIGFFYILDKDSDKYVIYCPNCYGDVMLSYPVSDPKTELEKLKLKQLKSTKYRGLTEEEKKEFYKHKNNRSNDV
jgi:hypothetical protein